jgi:hypothetical protein
MFKQKNYYQKVGEDMKKYILFGYWNYYPGGGLNDLLLNFDNMTEFNEEGVASDCDAYQILNMENGNYKSISIPYNMFEDVEYDKEEEARAEHVASFVRSFLEEE